MFKTIRKLVKRLVNKCQRKNKKAQVPVYMACPSRVSLILKARRQSQEEREQQQMQEVIEVQEEEVEVEDCLLEQVIDYQETEQTDAEVKVVIDVQEVEQTEIEVEMQQLEEQQDNIKVYEEIISQEQEQNIMVQRPLGKYEIIKLVYFDSRSHNEFNELFSYHYDLVTFTYVLIYCGVVQFKSEPLTQLLINDLLGIQQQQQVQVSKYQKTCELKQSRYFNQKNLVKRQGKGLQQLSSRQISAH